MLKGKGQIIKWKGDVPFPPIPNINYASFMLRAFSNHGGKVALVDGKTGESYTYGDLLRIIPTIRNGLAASGVGPGDVVMLITGNHVDMPATILSIMLLGATCVPINPASTPEEIKHIARISEAKWAVASKSAASKIVEAFKELAPDALRQMWIIGGTMTSKPSISDLMNSTSPEPTKTNKVFDAATTVALMPFSSGTTGLPKGVMLSHRNLTAIQIQRKFIASQNPGPTFNVYESSLVVLPMYHMMAFNLTMNGLFVGGKSVILTKFIPKDYFEAIERHKVTFSPVVPYIMRFLVDTPLMKNYDLSSIMMFGTGSEPVSASTLEAISKKSGRMALQGYGLTETTGIGTGTSPRDNFKPNCIGRFGPFFQIKVVDIETGEILGEGQDGELCVRGPVVMLGYANNPKATAETIDIEGWLHTGDIGHFDKDEDFYITGRIKDLIKVKGLQVAPAELEAIIRSIEGVSEVAVAGVPNARLGEAPRAWVVPSRGATIDTDAIIKHVADHVSPYKQLAGGVEVVTSLPKNHIGKIMRRQLRQTFEASRSKL